MAASHAGVAALDAMDDASDGGPPAPPDGLLYGCAEVAERLAPRIPPAAAAAMVTHGRDAGASGGITLLTPTRAAVTGLDAGSGSDSDDEDDDSDGVTACGSSARSVVVSFSSPIRAAVVASFYDAPLRELPTAAVDVAGRDMVSRELGGAGSSEAASPPAGTVGVPPPPTPAAAGGCVALRRQELPRHARRRRHAVFLLADGSLHFYAAAGGCVHVRPPQAGLVAIAALHVGLLLQHAGRGWTTLLHPLEGDLPLAVVGGGGGAQEVPPRSARPYCTLVGVARSGGSRGTYLLLADASSGSCTALHVTATRFVRGPTRGAGLAPTPPTAVAATIAVESAAPRRPAAPAAATTAVRSAAAAATRTPVVVPTPAPRRAPPTWTPAPRVAAAAGLTSPLASPLAVVSPLAARLAAVPTVDGGYLQSPLATALLAQSVALELGSPMVVDAVDNSPPDVPPPHYIEAPAPPPTIAPTRWVDVVVTPVWQVPFPVSRFFAASPQQLVGVCAAPGGGSGRQVVLLPPATTPPSAALQWPWHDDSDAGLPSAPTVQGTVVSPPAGYTLADAVPWWPGPGGGRARCDGMLWLVAPTGGGARSLLGVSPCGQPVVAWAAPTCPPAGRAGGNSGGGELVASGAGSATLLLPPAASLRLRLPLPWVSPTAWPSAPWLAAAVSHALASGVPLAMCIDAHRLMAALARRQSPTWRAEVVMRDGVAVPAAVTVASDAPGAIHVTVAGGEALTVHAPGDAIIAVAIQTVLSRLLAPQQRVHSHPTRPATPSRAAALPLPSAASTPASLALRLALGGISLASPAGATDEPLRLPLLAASAEYGSRAVAVWVRCVARVAAAAGVVIEHAGGEASMVASAVSSTPHVDGATWAADEWEAAARARLTLQPAGRGLGVLTMQGVTGRPASEVAIAAQSVASIVNAALGTPDCSGGARPGEDTDGLDSLEGLVRGGGVASVARGADHRFRTLARLLRSCRPLLAIQDRRPEASDHDAVAYQTSAMVWRGRRTMALAGGRGMLTYGTMAPNFTDPVQVPAVTLAVRILPHGVLHKVDISAIVATATGIYDWAEYTNGAAAGMRVAAGHAAAPSPLDGAAPTADAAAAAAAAADSHLQRLRAWVRAHRYTGVPPDLAAIAATSAAVASGFSGVLPTSAIPAVGAASGMVPPNAAHAGLLYAFGAAGLLNALTPADVLEYLAVAHLPTTVGILLGLAAGKRGSLDAGAAKALVLHVPAILPGMALDLDIPPIVQCCATLGLGLLYHGSRNRLMSEYLANEICMPPVVADVVEGADSYAACAGWALGTVNLGAGGGSEVLVPDPYGSGTDGGTVPLDDLLVRYMRGGAVARLPIRAGRLDSTRTGGGGGGGGGARGRSTEGSGAAADGSSGGGSAGQQALVREALQVDTATTAPAAVVALALMYARTGNARLADALALPDSLVQLDAVRFDVAMLRVLARGLIQWPDLAGDASPDHPGRHMARVAAEHAMRGRVRAWLAAQVPPTLRRVMRRLYARACAQTQGSSALMAQILAGITRPAAAGGGAAAAAAPAAAATTAAAAAPPSLTATVGGVTVDTQDGALEDIDEAHAASMYWMAVAGGCAVLGLVYAGTGNAVVRDELLAQLHLLGAMRASGSRDLFSRWAAMHASAGDACAAAVVASARVWVAEWREAHGGALPPAAALNAALFPPHVVAAAADDLLSAHACPPPGYPLRLNETGEVVPTPRPAPAAGGAKRSGGGGSVTQAVAAAVAPPLSPLMSATATVALAAGMVMAGSGDAATLGGLRELRKRMEAAVSYGDHLAVSYALGLVGLGGGRVTLSRDLDALPPLLALLMPVWPHGSASSVTWPQPARLLWPLATDARYLHTLDGDTGAAVAVPLRVVLHTGEALMRTAPCLLPELHTVAHVEVVGGHGWRHAVVPGATLIAQPGGAPPVGASSTTCRRLAPCMLRVFRDASSSKSLPILAAAAATAAAATTAVVPPADDDAAGALLAGAVAMAAGGGGEDGWPTDAAVRARLGEPGLARPTVALRAAFPLPAEEGEDGAVAATRPSIGLPTWPPAWTPLAPVTAYLDAQSVAEAAATATL